MSNKISKSPFTVVDDAGIEQKIKVVTIEDTLPSNTQIAGYAFVDMTGSLETTQSGSYKELRDISDIVEQDLRLKRATHIYSKTFKKQDLFDTLENPLRIDLHSHESLNPAANDATYALENYISKAIQVIIQNSTNKNLFLKASYSPSANVSSEDYTIKIPAGVTYDSETRIAHMRHIISFDAGVYDDLIGEVATSISYNTNLNNDLTIGQTFTGEATVTSIATNYFIIPFDPQPYSTLISEWYFSNTSGYDSMKVTGQARVANSGQAMTLFVSNLGANTPLNGQTVSITSTTPQVFDLSFPHLFDPTNPGLQSGDYELIATVSGPGELGDARVLFADLIKYVAP